MSNPQGARGYQDVTGMIQSSGKGMLANTF